MLWLAVSNVTVVAAQEVSTANAAITRVASGIYRYESNDGAALRGTERFTLLVHPDGARTMMMWHDLAAKNAQFTVVLRVDVGFQPLEAYVNYWNDGRHKGSAFFRREGGVVRGESDGPSGRRSQREPVPGRFSIGSHPVAGDGWHLANYDSVRAGKQEVALFSLEASGDVTKPVLGRFVPLSIELIGVETVSVPAGNFETTHYRIAGVNDLWVTGPDLLVVKSEIPARRLRYVLTEYSAR